MDVNPITGNATCGGATLDVLEASLDWWYAETLTYVASIISIQFNTDDVQTGWTIIPAHETFDITSAIAEETCTESLSVSLNSTYTGYDCFAVPTPVAAATTVLTQTAFVSPTASTGTGQIPNFATTPPPAAVTIPSSGGEFSAGTPFVYFSKYEIISKNPTTQAGSVGCASTTQQYNMAEPFSFEYAGADVNGSLLVGADVTGDVNPAFLGIVNVTNAIAGSWVAAPTVVVVLEEVFGAEAVLAAHTEISASSLQTPGSFSAPTFLTPLPPLSTIAFSAHVESTASFLELPTGGVSSSPVAQPTATGGLDTPGTDITAPNTVGNVITDHPLTRLKTFIAHIESSATTIILPTPTDAEAITTNIGGQEVTATAANPTDAPKPQVVTSDGGDDGALTVIPFLAHQESSAITLDIPVQPGQTVVTAVFSGGTVTATALSIAQPQQTAQPASGAGGIGGLLTAIASAIKPTNALQVFSQAEATAQPGFGPTASAIIAGLGGPSSQGGGGGSPAQPSPGTSGAPASGPGESGGSGGSNGGSSASPIVVPIAGSSVTAAPGAAVTLPDGQVAVPGGAAVTAAGGTVVSVGSSGVVVNGQTQNFAPTAGPSNNNAPGSSSGGSSGGSPIVVPIAGSSVTAAPGAAVTLPDGQVVSPGGPAVTVSGGTVVSVGSSGVVVNGQTQNFAPTAVAANSNDNAGTSGGSNGGSPIVVPIAGGSITAAPGAAVTLPGGQVARPGGPAVTASDGTVVSVAPAGIVVNGQTRNFAPTAAPVNNNVGGSDGFNAAPIVVPLPGGAGTVTAAPGSPVVVQGQTLSAGGPAFTAADGTVVSVGANGVVVGGTTHAFGSATQAPGAAANIPLLTVGTNTFTANAATQFNLGNGAILTPGGTAVISGTTVSLAAGATEAVIGGLTTLLSPPVITPAPAVTFDGTVFVPNAGSTLDIGDQLLTPGGQIVVSGSTLSLASNGRLVVNGQTQSAGAAGISGSNNMATITAPPSLTVNGQVFGPNGGSSYIINGQTLVAGGSAITISGPNGVETVSLNSAANELVTVMNGQTYTSAIGPLGAMATGSPVITLGNGDTYTAVSYDSNNGYAYVIDGQTLTEGGTITANGETVVLDSAGTAITEISAGHTSVETISGAYAVMPTAAPILSIGGTTFYPVNGGATYIIDGETLTPGEVETVTLGGKTYVISLSPQATILMIEMLGPNGRVTATSFETLFPGTATATHMVSGSQATARVSQAGGPEETGGPNAGLASGASSLSSVGLASTLCLAVGTLVLAIWL